MLTLALRHYLLALQFFTRIPVTGRLAAWVGYSPALLRASAGHFPGIGWVVGGVCAAVHGVLTMALPALPASAWVAALGSTAAGVLLTGAFHEDGLADTADGLGGGMDRERALLIMKDSRIGSYGAVALVLALMAKCSLLVLLQQVGTVWALAGLFAAHVGSRLMPVFLIRFMVHVGDLAGSKSKPLADGISRGGVVVALCWAMGGLALVAPLLPLQALIAALMASAAAATGMAWRLQRRLQGYTGDGLGATQQLAELGFYLGLVWGAAT